MTTYTIFADVSDGMLTSYNAAYSSAVVGASAYGNTTDTSFTVGQWYSGAGYFIHEAFAQFDTSAIGTAGETPSSATLSAKKNFLTPSPDYTLNVRAADWGASLTGSDWLTPTQLVARTKVASIGTAGLSTAYNDFVSETAFPAAIVTSGYTRLVIASDRMEAQTAPSGDERVDFRAADSSGTYYDPRLVVVAAGAAAISAQADQSVAVGAGAAAAVLVSASSDQSISASQSATSAAPIAAQAAQSISVGSSAAVAAQIAAAATQSTSIGQGATASAAARSLSRVGSATGTTTATMPAHQAGDIVVVFAFRDGSATAPSLPASPTYQSAGTRSGTSCSGRVGYRIATSSSETVGTWTNATSVVVVVYRATTSAAIGAVASNAGTTNTLNYPALTLQDSGGSSWVAGLVGHRSTNQGIETAPSGMMAVTDVVDATDEAAAHDTNAGVTAWSSTNQTLTGTASGWVSFVIEIIALPVISAAAAQSIAVGQSATAVVVSTAAIADQALVAGQSAAAAATVSGASSQTLAVSQAAVASALVQGSAAQQIAAAQSSAGAVLVAAQASGAVAATLSAQQYASARIVVAAAATDQCEVRQSTILSIMASTEAAADQALLIDQVLAAVVPIAGCSDQGVAAWNNAALQVKISFDAEQYISVRQDAVVTIWWPPKVSIVTITGRRIITTFLGQGVAPQIRGQRRRVTINGQRRQTMCSGHLTVPQFTGRQ